MSIACSRNACMLSSGFEGIADSHIQIAQQILAVGEPLGVDSGQQPQIGHFPLAGRTRPYRLF
jgi:hypothetical protein